MKVGDLILWVPMSPIPKDVGVILAIHEYPYITVYWFEERLRLKIEYYPICMKIIKKKDLTNLENRL